MERANGSLIFMWLLEYRILRCTTHETQLTAGAIENTLIWEVACCFWKWLLVSNQGYFYKQVFFGDFFETPFSVDLGRHLDQSSEISERSEPRGDFYKKYP